MTFLEKTPPTLKMVLQRIFLMQESAEVQFGQEHQWQVPVADQLSLELQLEPLSELLWLLVISCNKVSTLTTLLVGTWYEVFLSSTSTIQPRLFKSSPAVDRENLV
jgi:hypothetical protein